MTLEIKTLALNFKLAQNIKKDYQSKALERKSKLLNDGIVIEDSSSNLNI